VAKADLNKLAKRIQKEIEQTSTAYRRLVSDRKAHTITVSQQKILTQVKREMESRAGYEKNNLPKTIADIIDTEVPKMVMGMYKDIKSYNTDQKFSFVSELIGNSTRFTFNLAAKKGRSANIFNAFRKVKQDNQKVLLRKLRAAIKKLNAGRKEGNQIRTIGKNFLDIGHQEGSAVSTQRTQKAQQVLFEWGTNISGGERFLKEISDKVNLKLTKKDGEPVDTVEAELESKFLNRKRGGGAEKALSLQLAKDLDTILKGEGADMWVNQGGSDSKFEKIEKTFLNPFAAKARRSAGLTVNFSEKKVKKSNTTASGKARKVKVTKGARTLDKLVGATPAFAMENRQNMFALMALINKKLPDVVKKNMRSPGLESRTGALARSVEIKDVRPTRKGFPSFGYTYGKEPYQVFETGKGLEPWATPERDPRNLIDRSIREIAADMALGRFFTRRL